MKHRLWVHFVFIQYCNSLTEFILNCHSLYLIYPRCSPDLQNDELKRIQALLPTVETGEGRSFQMQMLYQFIGLVVTLSIAIIAGALTGKRMNLLNEKFILNMQKLFSLLKK